jgi:hypothetical protein
MKAGSAAAAALLTAVLAMAGAPATLHAQTVAAGFFAPAPPPAPVNSPVFAVRAPLPGQPAYLTTIKFIDDGMRYVDPLSLFYVSPAGEMCFRTHPDYPTTIYENYYRDWCIFPQTVDRVEVVTNPTINEVRVWCMRAYPQCAHSPADGGFANYIVAPTLDYRQERVAVENLVYMMGGGARFAEPRGYEAREAFR